jgi:hypothetical protein
MPAKNAQWPVQGRSVVVTMCMAQPGSLVARAAPRLMLADILLGAATFWSSISYRSSIVTLQP